MQREGSPVDSFPEPLDLNHGSNSENVVFWDDNLNPVETRSSGYAIANSEGNANQMDVGSEFVQRFSGWDCGESSSRTSYLQGHDESPVRPGCRSCSDAYLINWSPELRNISVARHAGGNGPARFDKYCSNCAPSNSSTNSALIRESSNRGSQGASQTQNLCRDQESFPGFCTTDSAINDFRGSSSSTWGSSSKRKALEGSSGQFFRGGSSRAGQSMDMNLVQDPLLGQNVSPENSLVSSGHLSLTLANQSVQLDPSQFGSGQAITPSIFQSSSASRITETSARNCIPISGHARNVVTFDAPRNSPIRSVGIRIARPSGYISGSAASDSRLIVESSIDRSNPVNSSFPMHRYEARGSSSASLLSPGERRFPAARVEVGVQRYHRTNPECTMTVSVPEIGTALQEHVDWSFTPGTSSSRNHPTVSSHGSSVSGARSSTVWLPHPVQGSQHHQRPSEAAHWNPYAVMEPGVRRTHYSLSYPSAIPSNEGTTSRRSHHRSAPTSPYMLGGDVGGPHAPSALEGRQRLIRQLLNAMRQGSRIRIEDYMLIDPLFAELHDSYRGMRLDVDNMSYEELLVLGERIGNVSTGLSEEKIQRLLRIRKQAETTQNLEPCCICQEDYAAGDDIGVLDCGHEFHIACIKQWLTLKNLCPICKMTALGS